MADAWLELGIGVSQSDTMRAVAQLIVGPEEVGELLAGGLALERELDQQTERTRWVGTQSNGASSPVARRPPSTWSRIDMLHLDLRRRAPRVSGRG